MKNYVQPGHTITYANATAVTAGTAVLIGALLAVAVSSYAANEAGEYQLVGVFTLPVEAATTPGAGDKAYWDAGNARLTTTANGNTLVGTFHAAKAAGAPEAPVRLSGHAA